MCYSRRIPIASRQIREEEVIIEITPLQDYSLQNPPQNVSLSGEGQDVESAMAAEENLTGGVNIRNIEGNLVFNIFMLYEIQPPFFLVLQYKL